MNDKQVQQTPDEKFEAISNIRDNLAEKFLELGEILSEVKNSKLYLFKGYETFKAFLNNEYNLSTSLANKLMRIQRLFLEEMDLCEETLLQIGYDRLGVICGVVEKADWQGRDEWVAKAMEMPLNDLKDHLKAKKSQETETDLKAVLTDQFKERVTSFFNCSWKEAMFKLGLYFYNLTDEQMEEIKAVVKQMQRAFEQQQEAQDERQE